MIQRPQYLQQIRPFMDKDVVKVLTGMRRSGKSALLQLIQQDLLKRGIPKERIFSINFESLEYASSDVTVIYQKVKKYAAGQNSKLYLFLDEIQELPAWEKLVNSLRVDFDCDIYITGSNSKLLSGELATYLAGRYIEMKVYPLSFQEISSISRDKDANLLFSEYLEKGGMPFIYANSLSVDEAGMYLKDIYSSIVLKDIVSRHTVRDVDLLNRIIFYILSNVGNIFSGSSVEKYLKNEKRRISTETIYNYVSYLQEACFIHMAKREDLPGKKILSTGEKIYAADHGIREALLGSNKRDIAQILENIVYIELLRRGYDVTVGRDETREVDFIARKGGEKTYYQVTYLLADDSTVEREFAPLQNIPDNYPKYVLSLDPINRSREGIINMSIIDFLKDEK